MSLAQEAVRQFGQTMGIEGLSIDAESKTVELLFENGTLCMIEDLGDRGLLVLVCRELEFVDDAVLHTMMHLCDYRSTRECELRAGCDGSRLCFWSRIDEAAIDVSRIDQTLSILEQMHVESIGH